MSSDNVRRETIGKVERPNKSCSRPLFLRLDSSGQDCSSNSPTPTMCKACEVKCSRNNKLAGSGLDMNCVLDTATSYVNSAGAYLGGFCQYTTANHLARKVGGSSVFNYINKLGTKRDLCDNIDSASTNTATNMPVHNQPQVVTPTWSHSIFDALKCRFKSGAPSCPNSKASTATTPEPYKPPHVKRFMNGSLTVDPNLTPYNARLLLKSKQCSQSKSDILDTPKRKQVENMSQTPLAESTCKLSAIVTQDEPQLKNIIVPEVQVPDTVTQSELCKSSDIPCQALAANPKAESKKMESDDVKDWFDHENSDEKCIPISIKLENSCMSCSPEEKSSPILNSWLSVENDTAVKQEESGDISSHCDTPDLESEIKTNCPITSSASEVPCDKLRFETDRCISDNENPKHEEGKISVLYIRNMSKKTRPSSKKRRRQKKQQTEAQEGEASTGKKRCSMKKLNVSIATSSPSNQTVSNSSIAFILGFEPSNSSSDTMFDSDINSGSDWSDSSDLECDGDGDEGFENQQDWFPDILCPINLHITCSMMSPPEAQSTSCNSLDDINLSWQLNMAMSPQESRKKKSDKKVQFANDEQLTTVHRMITWSHAYQAARKGPWEEYARDRGRFQRRIHDSQKMLEPFLLSSHRDAVFRGRFDDSNL